MSCRHDPFTRNSIVVETNSLDGTRRIRCTRCGLTAQIRKGGDVLPPGKLPTRPPPDLPSPETTS